MASMSDYLEGALADHCTRTTNFTPPTTLYIGLLTVLADDASTGDFGVSTGTEVSGGSYARVAVSRADAEFTDPAVDGISSNVNAITFMTATAGWGTVVGFFIADAATDGNVLFHGSLSVNKTIDSGDTFEFAVNQLTITWA